MDAGDEIRTHDIHVGNVWAVSSNSLLKIVAADLRVGRLQRAIGRDPSETPLGIHQIGHYWSAESFFNGLLSSAQFYSYVRRAFTLHPCLLVVFMFRVNVLFLFPISNCTTVNDSHVLATD
jgi:hypothetical protein